jgi:hypothetical protein
MPTACAVPRAAALLAQTALLGETNGSGAAIRGRATFAGNAGVFENTNPNNATTVLSVLNNGIGQSASFQVNNANNTNVAVSAVNFGRGGAGEFIVGNGTNQRIALDAFTNGLGMAGRILVNNSNPALIATTTGSGGGLVVRSDGTGAAGQFFNTTSTGAGVVITTAGGAGLQVFGGSKNAVVATPSGARSLYTGARRRLRRRLHEPGLRGPAQGRRPQRGIQLPRGGQEKRLRDATARARSVGQYVVGDPVGASASLRRASTDIRAVHKDATTVTFLGWPFCCKLLPYSQLPRLGSNQDSSDPESRNTHLNIHHNVGSQRETERRYRSMPGETAPQTAPLRDE